MSISNIEGVHQPCPHWNGIHHKEEADQFMRVTIHGNILRASCFTLEIKILWGENWKRWQSLGVKPRTPLAWAANALPLSHNSRAITNPHNLYMHCTSGPNASVTHLATTWYVPSELHWGLTRKFPPSGNNPCWVVSHSKRSDHHACSCLPHVGNKGIKQQL